MFPKLQLTTSWDDGHPLDLRVAELLAKHDLQGTFYIPLQDLENSRPTLTASQIRDISSTFEVGAHTIHHTDVKNLANDQARFEISESKSRLEQITGKDCRIFSFPKGRYAGRHLNMAAEAGFSAVRTIEMMSLAPPRKTRGLAVIPTTVQAYSHGPAAYIRNCVKRLSCSNLWAFLLHGRAEDWASVAMSMFELGLARGGVFHLWGHSWEIEESKQWSELERVFAALRSGCQSVPCLTNSELCTDNG